MVAIPSTPGSQYLGLESGVAALNDTLLPAAIPPGDSGLNADKFTSFGMQQVPTKFLHRYLML